MIELSKCCAFCKNNSKGYSRRYSERYCRLYKKLTNQLMVCMNFQMTENKNRLAYWKRELNNINKYENTN